MQKHKNCRYKFLKWLITKAVENKKVYWLLWGILAAMCVAGINIAELG